MKLLILTQVVDKNHPILGFFHRWIEEFAKNCEKVTVICLQRGEYTLPDNVQVYSLGKEEGKGRLVRVWRFYKYIWTLRHQYDSVFVHMNQIYVILGGIFWRLQGKKVGLWYMHGSIPISLHIAEKITNVIFTGSPESFKIPSKKVIVTGHGIDTDLFVPDDTVAKTIDLITVGRISKAKNLTALVDVLSEVRKEHDVTLTIVGETLSEEDAVYKKQLEEYIDTKRLTHFVHFIGAVPNEELPKILNQSKVFIHAATNGSLDKALLEPMAAGIPVVSMAPGASSLPLRDWKVSSTHELAYVVVTVLNSSVMNRCNLLSVYTQDVHSISYLNSKIVNILC